MKTKFYCFIFIFSVLSVSNVFSQEFYENREKRYSGFAGAIYVGSYETFNWCCDTIVESLKERGKYGGVKKKLTNEEIFLIDSALGEYSLRKGEVYMVSVRLIGKEIGLNIAVEITKPKPLDYDYVAFIYFN